MELAGLDLGLLPCLCAPKQVDKAFLFSCDAATYEAGVGSHEGLAEALGSHNLRNRRNGALAVVRRRVENKTIVCHVFHLQEFFSKLYYSTG